MWLKSNLKHPASKMTRQVIYVGNIFFFPDSHPRWIPWVLNGAFEFSRWLFWEQSRNMADWLFTVGVGAFSFMYASHHGKLFIFILGIYNSLRDRLPSKGREQQPFNYVLFSCVHTCPDAASDIGEISGFFGNIIKKTWHSLSVVRDCDTRFHTWWFSKRRKHFWRSWWRNC